MTVMNNTPHYFKSIRNITAVFGSIFDNISVVRTNAADEVAQRFVVPLVYANKNAWYKRLKSKVNEFDSNSDSTINVGSVLPAMSFNMTSMQYNAARKMNTLNNIAAQISINNPSSTKIKSYAPAPYDFNFELSVYSKNIDDGLQIIEQIAPYFQPSINVKLKEMNNPEIYNDIQISLEDITPDDDYDWTGGRLVTWTLSFRVTGNIYPAFNDTKVILENTVSILDKLNNDGVLSTVEVDAENLQNIV